MRTVVVTGATGRVGRRLCALLGDAPDVGETVALDVRVPRRGEGPDLRRTDLLTADLEPIFDGADVIVHLASGFRTGRDDLESAGDDLRMLRRVLSAAAAVGAGHLVLMSSATVYGAWPDNPVPVTEDAAIRPNPGFVFAVHKAEIERLADAWQRSHRDAVVTVLRPATARAAEATWLASEVPVESGVDVLDRPPVQILHLDDLARAVLTVVTERPKGALNVAPDGWIPAEELRSLAGPTARVRVPGRLVRLFGPMTRRLGGAGLHAGALPYLLHPWVVANDRLRALGWQPDHTNQEAFVEGHRPGRWERLGARRRQEATLGAAGLLATGVIAGVVALIRRLQRRA